jgi:hypothetical protein
MIETFIFACWLDTAWVMVETSNDLDYYIEDTKTKVYVVAEVIETGEFICIKE